MWSFWISSMVPIVRVLLLAKAKLHGGKKPLEMLCLEGRWQSKNLPHLHTPQSCTFRDAADFSSPRLLSPKLASSGSQGKLEAHLSG